MNIRSNVANEHQIMFHKENVFYDDALGRKHTTSPLHPFDSFPIIRFYTDLKKTSAENYILKQARGGMGAPSFIII